MQLIEHENIDIDHTCTLKAAIVSTIHTHILLKQLHSDRTYN